MTLTQRDCGQGMARLLRRSSMGDHSFSKLLRLAIDESPDQIYISDVETGRFLDLNEGACRALGYSREELLRLHNYDIDVALTRELWEASAVHLSGIPGELTFRTIHMRKDGSTFRSEVRSRVVTVDGRSVTIGVVRDITSLVAIEEALRTSQRQYESLVRNLPGVVHRCLLDAPNTTLYIDERIEELTGVCARDFLRGLRALDEFISEDDRALVAKAWHEAAEKGGSYDITITFNLPAGEQRLVREVGLVVQPDGDVPATIEGIFFDMTERSEQERVLRDAFDAEHRRFEKVVDASHQVVYEGDHQTQTLTFSGPFREVFGYTPGSQGSDAETWRARIHPDDRQRVLHEQMQKHRPGELVEFEYRWQHADGSYRWVWDRAMFEFDAEGHPTTVLGVMQDITPRKELEAQVSSAQRMESVGALAAGLAHDVNNFLTTILGNVDFALMRLAGPDPQQWPELEDARRAALGCADLVQKLLAFARPTPGGHLPLTIEGVLEDSLRILQRLAGPDVSITTEISPGCPPFAGDSVQVQQLLMNLVANARDAMDGRGNLIIRGEHALAEPGGPLHGYLALSVTDDGAGIPSALHERIFEPYFTTRPFGGGTGLGLSIVHGIARAHGGRIDVQSSPGNGATFTVHFPALPVERPPEAPRP